MIDSSTMARLVALGRAKGHLTIEDLKAALPVDTMDPEDIALVVVHLEDAGIPVELDERLLGRPSPAGPVTRPVAGSTTSTGPGRHPPPTPGQSPSGAGGPIFGRTSEGGATGRPQCAHGRARGRYPARAARSRRSRSRQLMGSAPSKRIDTPLQIRTVSAWRKIKCPAYSRPCASHQPRNGGVIRDGGRTDVTDVPPPATPLIGRERIDRRSAGRDPPDLCP